METLFDELARKEGQDVGIVILSSNGANFEMLS
jgi:hypothetical protein